jgi:hypothetical protein
MSRPRIAQLLAFIFLVASSGRALANDCYRLDTRIGLLLNGTNTARASGEVNCFASNGDVNFEASFTGNMKIHQVNPSIDYTSPISGSGQWIGGISAPADYTTKTCYQAFISATSGNTSGSNQSSEQCTPDPPAPTPDHPIDHNPLDGLSEGTQDPIVINLRGPYKLSGLEDPVTFDINASGHAIRIGWTARDADVAFLAFDRNGNGKIDDGSELFGNATPLSQGGRAPNGFVGLAQYDVNGDGVVDASDPVWNELLLWVDANHNGVSEPSELRHITDSSITALEIQHHWTGRRDQSGNRFGYEGQLREGRRARSFYDVFFVTAR